MKCQLIGFGRIQVGGREYDYDVVIEHGKVRKRSKKPSKAFRSEFGHTPLSAREEIPWHQGRLFIGTGAYGRLPVTDDVFAEARKRGIDLVTRPTGEVCRLLEDLDEQEVNAILHITC